MTQHWRRPVRSDGGEVRREGGLRSFSTTLMAKCGWWGRQRPTSRVEETPVEFQNHPATLAGKEFNDRNVANPHYEASNHIGLDIWMVSRRFGSVEEDGTVWWESLMVDHMMGGYTMDHDLGWSVLDPMTHESFLNKRGVNVTRVGPVLANFGLGPESSDNSSGSCPFPPGNQLKADAGAVCEFSGVACGDFSGAGDRRANDTVGLSIDGLGACKNNDIADTVGGSGNTKRRSSELLVEGLVPGDISSSGSGSGTPETCSEETLYRLNLEAWAGVQCIGEVQVGDESLNLPELPIQDQPVEEEESFEGDTLTKAEATKAVWRKGGLSFAEKTL
ncbi:hypothetical protein PIB30_059513 [Stylosanthes scabra]|uniref:Uncharacterized protein n=1 Tax=Stylosanthes scabra TaxID=79078 RepID=A0ABU6ZJ07_9FABA|nr:hypothetical protein [Stylosanthes scabra]